MNALSGRWMHELQVLRVQHQAICLATVKTITDNGSIKTERMRGVNPKLVGAASVREKNHPGSFARRRLRGIHYAQPFPIARAVLCGFPCRTLRV